MPHTDFSDYSSSMVIFIFKNTMKMYGGKKQHFKKKKTKKPHLVWNEAHIISNGNPLGYTGDCSVWWLIAKLSEMPTSCWRATKRDKMAYSKDLTLQMSLLPGFEWTIYVSFLLFCKVHKILLQGEYCIFKSSQPTVLSIFSTAHFIWKDVCVVKLWLSWIRVSFFLLTGHFMYNL